MCWVMQQSLTGQTNKTQGILKHDLLTTPSMSQAVKTFYVYQYDDNALAIECLRSSNNSVLSHPIFFSYIIFFP